MTLLLVFYLPVVYGLTYSDVYDYQINEITPHLISVSNTGGNTNVTVKYKYDSLVYEAKPFWLVNGRVITDGEDGFQVKHSDVGWVGLSNINVSTSSKSPPDNFLHKASILIPSTFRVTSLQIQIVSNLYDVIMDINLLRPPTGKTLIENIPQHKMTMAPRHTITYERDDPLQIRVSFTTLNLRNFRKSDVTAELIELDACLHPTKSERRSSIVDKDMEIWKPSWSDELSFREMYRLDDLDYVIQRLNITFDKDKKLPKGILKISSGYRSRSCSILSGIKVTMISFLQPPVGIGRGPFFPENKVAFLDNKRNYYVNYGHNVDLTIAAIGGHLGENQFDDVIPIHPEVWLQKRNQRFESLTEIDRLFQRDIIVRLRNVTVADSGRYTAYAKIGSYTTQLDIHIYVTDIPFICGR